MTAGVWFCTYLDNVTCAACRRRIQTGERMVKDEGRWRHLWPCPSDDIQETDS